MNRRTLTALAALVLLVPLAVVPAAQAAPGDPCESSYAGDHDAAKLRAYLDCRADRIEERIDALATPAPTVTVTAAPEPAPTVTLTPAPAPTVTVTVTATPVPEPTGDPTDTPEPTTEPTPTPTPAPTVTPGVPDLSTWPNAATTGVPDGVALTPYTGPLTITADNTIIDAQTVTGILTIRARNVTITRSVINGGVNVEARDSAYSFTITDSEVRIGDNLNTGLMRANFTATRVEITGGRRSAYCMKNCVIQDSWVHDQGGDPGGDAHFSGIRQEQDGIFRHNTLVCEAQRGSGTGCSAALTGYGDFAPVQNNLIENNLFIGSQGGGASMCAYGGSSGAEGGKPYGHLARDIRFVGNVFTKGANGKCGNLGTVAHFDPSLPGNLWAGNMWSDGTPMPTVVR